MSKKFRVGLTGDRTFMQLQESSVIYCIRNVFYEGLRQRKRTAYSKVTKTFRDFCHRDKVNILHGQNCCISQLIIFIIAISKLGFRLGD